MGPFEDAALLRPRGARDGLVFTIDVITPIVDDPGAFGRIAAANALSDVYAMGGKPQVALSFAGLPEELEIEGMRAVLAGMAEKAREAGCAIVGGHTIKDGEPKCGLAVIGTVEEGRAWTHRGAKAGQALVLTKPLGTGVIAQALRNDEADPAWVSAATRSMETLNAQACELGRQHGATAATDVTGFGLLAHLKHVAEASSVAARVRAADVPLLDGALEVARRGFVPGGTKRNLGYVKDHLEGADDIDEALALVLADAQTSGGLLLALPLEGADALVRALPGAAVIGAFEDGPPGRLRFS